MSEIPLDSLKSWFKRLLFLDAFTLPKDWSFGVSFLSEIEVKKGGFLIQFF